MATAGSYGDSSSYYMMKECHQKAYSLISEALDIDESGIGNKESAIDYYSSGVTELEKGINMDIAESDPNYERAVKLRKKMIANIEMAKDRVKKLCEGKELKGTSKSIGSPAPTKSLAAAVQKRKRDPNKTKQRSTAVSKRSTSVPAKKEVKGVDQALVDMIMSEIHEGITNVTWDSIVGLENAKRTLQEIVVLPALNPEVFHLFVGLRAPSKGLLLFGPPGNGKTMMAKAVAHESKSTFFNISSSSLTSKYVGEGEKLVKALFTVARHHQPSIIFIDEVDSLLSRRGNSEHDTMRRMKNEFLLQFDGMSSTDNDRFLVMATTNKPDELDDAALRRFSKRIYVPLPDLTARIAAIKQLLLKHRHNLNDTHLSSIGCETTNYSFSDLTGLAKDAALGPIRELNMESLKSVKPDQIRPIEYHDFVQSLTQIKPSVSMDLVQSLEEWNRSYGVG